MLREFHFQLCKELTVKEQLNKFIKSSEKEISCVRCFYINNSFKHCANKLNCFLSVAPSCKYSKSSKHRTNNYLNC